MVNLKTNYQDDVLDSAMNGKRRYNLINNPDGTVSFEDVTDYTQIGDDFSAKDLNGIAEEVNDKLNKSGGKMSGKMVFDEDSTEEGMIDMTNLGELYEILRAISGSDPTLIINNGMYTKGVGSLNLNAGKMIQLITTAERLSLENSGESGYSAHFRPRNDNKCTLGTSNRRFHSLWAGNATVQTSDARQKENIKPLGLESAVTIPFGDEYVDIHSELFDRLKPVQFNFVEGGNRTCYGFLAQDVADAMSELGITENELDLVHHDYWKDEETGEEKDIYGIAYANLIAMLVHEVQKCKAKIETMELEINNLKGI